MNVLLALFFASLTIGIGLVAFTAWATYRIERAVPPVGRTIDVDGLRLHYVDQGSGPVILMIHGLSAQVQTFTYALSSLLCSRYRLLIFDRPGNGYSQAASSATLQKHASVAAAFLRALGVERALVVGHSLGGAIALALAVDHPELVAGLALIAPATQRQDAPPDAMRGLALRSDLARIIIGWTVVIPASLAARDKTLHALFAPDPIASDFGTRGGSLLPLRPWAFRHASRDLIGAGEQLGTYAKRHSTLEMPIGMLFGTGDQILDYRVHGQGFATRVPGVDLRIIHGGHMLPLTQPEICAQFIEHMAQERGLQTPVP